MATGKITKRFVDGVMAGESDLFVWDEALKGFGIKVTSGGSKTYLVQYRMGGRGSPTKRYTIGRHGSPWTPSTAREEAERVLIEVAKGTDPRLSKAEQRRKATSLAFNSYVERYLRDHGLKRWRTSTYPTVASNLRRYVVPVLGERSLADVKRADLVAIFDSLPPDKPALPRNVYAHASRVFSWAVERGELERSPFDGLKAPASVASRDRVLNEAELRRAWEASGRLGRPYGPLFQLMMLTGQRLGEVAGIRWEEVDRTAAEWVIPADRAKNGVAHVVPLAPASIAVLTQVADGCQWPGSGFVFTTTGRTSVSGHSRAKSRLDAVIAASYPDAFCQPWRLHDLRRSLATGFQRMGIRFEVTEAVLNHVSGSRSGVAGVYQRHTWGTEKREALELWAQKFADWSV